MKVGEHYYLNFFWKSDQYASYMKLILRARFLWVCWLEFCSETGCIHVSRFTINTGNLAHLWCFRVVNSACL